VDNNGAKKTLSDLLAVMAALRTPGTGCPWDLQQTFATIAPYTIEEAYEVADAIARGDVAHLKDELGDLLLQVVYHARMAEEQGAFAFADVADAITAKMIRRHPHVFGSAEQRAAGAAPGFWERAKAAEKDETAAAGVLDGVPTALPALTRAIKLQSKAAKVGFDWPSLAPVLAKLKEELAELEEVIDARSTPARPSGSDSSSDAVAEEFGDLLFVIANVARHLKLDPEAALRAANAKFIRRFRYIEARLAADGRAPSDSDLAEMDALWDEAKTKGL
jgi:nucleoside triphosphate diphosphatase